MSVTIVIFWTAGLIFGYGIAQVQHGLQARRRIAERRARLNALIAPHTLDDEP